VVLSTIVGIGGFESPSNTNLIFLNSGGWTGSTAIAGFKGNLGIKSITKEKIQKEGRSTH
jgi:hypothetical protein